MTTAGRPGQQAVAKRLRIYKTGICDSLEVGINPNTQIQNVTSNEFWNFGFCSEVVTPTFI